MRMYIISTKQAQMPNRINQNLFEFDFLYCIFGCIDEVSPQWIHITALSSISFPHFSQNIRLCLLFQIFYNALDIIHKAEVVFHFGFDFLAGVHNCCVTAPAK